MDWKPLAIQLEMSATKIEEIDVNNRGRVADCRYSMIQFWLQSDISRSWQKLIGALKSTDYSVLAEEIKSTYCPMFQGQLVKMVTITQVNQKLLYRESDWWYVVLVVQKARKLGTVC